MLQSRDLSWKVTSRVVTMVEQQETGPRTDAFEQEGEAILHPCKIYLDVSTHIYIVSHYINLHALVYTGAPFCIILNYYGVTKHGKLACQYNY